MPEGQPESAQHFFFDEFSVQSALSVLEPYMSMRQVQPSLLTEQEIFGVSPLLELPPEEGVYELSSPQPTATTTTTATVRRAAPIFMRKTLCARTLHDPWSFACDQQAIHFAPTSPDRPRGHCILHRNPVAGARVRQRPSVSTAATLG